MIPRAATSKPSRKFQRGAIGFLLARPPGLLLVLIAAALSLLLGGCLAEQDRSDTVPVAAGTTDGTGAGDGGTTDGGDDGTTTDGGDGGTTTDGDDGTTTDGDDGTTTDGDDGSTGTPALSFAADVEPILAVAGCADCHGFSGTENPCASCHASLSPNDASPSMIVVLEHASLVDQTSTAVPGESVVASGTSDSSVFWWLLSGDSRYSGAMNNSMGLNAISASDKTAIQQWIDEGAEP